MSLDAINALIRLGVRMLPPIGSVVEMDGDFRGMVLAINEDTLNNDGTKVALLSDFSKALAPNITKIEELAGDILGVSFEIRAAMVCRTYQLRRVVSLPPDAPPVEEWYGYRKH